jgi:hypothetical protein
MANRPRRSRDPFKPRATKLLWGLAAGLCSHPQCRRPLVADETDVDPARPLGEMAHIVGHSVIGPRGDANFPQDKLDLYDNLILLCAHHHTEIDAQPASFSVALLQQWRRDHEAWVQDCLTENLTRITFKELEMVTTAIASHASAPTSTFNALPIEEKMRRNELSDRVRVLLQQAMAGAAEVQAYVQHMASYDDQFPERLRDGFRQRYAEDIAEGLRGDELFVSLVDFAEGDSTDLFKRAAGLSVLGYFFGICEVFES